MKGTTWGIVAVVLIALFVGLWWFTTGMNLARNAPPTPEASTNPTAASDAAIASHNVPTTQTLTSKVLPKDITSVLATIPNASGFTKLLTSSGVASEISSKGPYTIFVPMNQRFPPLPPTMTKVEIKRLVEYHIVSGKDIDINIQQTGTIQALSIDMLNFSVRPGDKSARVNSSVALEKYTTTNGTIYLIDQVLLPPQKTQ